MTFGEVKHTESQNGQSPRHTRSFSFVPFNPYLGTMEEIGSRHQKPNMDTKPTITDGCATFLNALCI